MHFSCSLKKEVDRKKPAPEFFFLVKLLTGRGLQLSSGRLIPAHRVSAYNSNIINYTKSFSSKDDTSSFYSNIVNSFQRIYIDMISFNEYEDLTIPVSIQFLILIITFRWNHCPLFLESLSSLLMVHRYRFVFHDYHHVVLSFLSC